MDHRYVLLSEAADAGMRSGDLLLYQAGRSVVDLFISRAGRTRYCHAGRAWLALPGLMAQHWRALDTIAWHGGRNVSLAAEVSRCPGRIDVFEPNPGAPKDDENVGYGVAGAWGRGYDPSLACDWLLANVVDQPYGWWSICRASLLHLPFVRLLVRPQTDDQAFNGGLLPYCSHAQAMADRVGGFDPVVNLADRLVEPGDLARSPFYRYRFTLTEDVT